MSTSTVTSVVSFLPWGSGESLSPSNLNRHQSAITVVTSITTSDAGSSNGSLVPVSPIISEVQTSGVTANPPFIQLKNSSGTKNIWIYELYVSLPSGNASSQTVLITTTASPTDLTGGSITTGASCRLDQTDATAIQGLLLGVSDKGAVISSASAYWAAKIDLEGQAGWNPVPIRAPGSFPWIITSSQALEISGGISATNSYLRAYAVWDEI